MFGLLIHQTKQVGTINNNNYYGLTDKEKGTTWGKLKPLKTETSKKNKTLKHSAAYQRGKYAALIGLQ